MRPDRDWVQLDPALGYGLTEYLRFLDMAERWAGRGGGSFRMAAISSALNIAAGLQLGGSESYPGVFQPYGGFADNIPIVDGYVRPHEEPGIGMELRRKDVRRDAQAVGIYIGAGGWDHPPLDGEGGEARSTRAEPGGVKPRG